MDKATKLFFAQTVTFRYKHELIQTYPQFGLIASS